MYRIRSGRCGVAASFLFLAMLFWSAKANASGIIYEFNSVFGANSVAPDGSSPWVEAAFQDVSGGVLLTIDNPNLSTTEFVDKMYFNLDPSLDPTLLTFKLQSSGGVFTAPTMNTFSQGAQVGGSSGNKAYGDGYYDMVVDFAQSGTDNLRFNDGDSVSYLIAGITGLTAADFGYLSDPGKGVNSPGPFYAAAHIQGTNNGQNSAEVEPSAGPQPIPVPEPSPVALLVLSIGLWGACRLGRQLAKV